jgi:hypothetical protein
MRLTMIAIVLATAVGCGSSSSSTSPGAPTTSGVLHTDLTDPRGDAVPPAGVTNPADLSGGTVDVDVNAGVVTIVLRFAPGTLDGQTTRVAIDLDTDQNAATGIASVGLGIDYTLDVFPRTNQTRVAQAAPATCGSGGTCFTDIGAGTLTVGTDTLTATVPLSMLGGASGRMNLRVNAYYFQSGPPTAVGDWMPDASLAAAHVP